MPPKVGPSPATHVSSLNPESLSANASMQSPKPRRPLQCERLVAQIKSSRPMTPQEPRPNLRNLHRKRPQRAKFRRLRESISLACTYDPGQARHSIRLFDCAVLARRRKNWRIFRLRYARPLRYTQEIEGLTLFFKPPFMHIATSKES
jgi:hypothetical protein